jgi:hypothetical protein
MIERLTHTSPWLLLSLGLVLLGIFTVLLHMHIDVAGRWADRRKHGDNPTAEIAHLKAQLHQRDTKIVNLRLKLRKARRARWTFTPAVDVERIRIRERARLARQLEEAYEASCMIWSGQLDEMQVENELLRGRLSELFGERDARRAARRLTIRHDTEIAAALAVLASEEPAALPAAAERTVQLATITARMPELTA